MHLEDLWLPPLDRLLILSGSSSSLEQRQEPVAPLGLEVLYLKKWETPWKLATLLINDRPVPLLARQQIAEPTRESWPVDVSQPELSRCSRQVCEETECGKSRRCFR